jgi:tRNA 2-thiouridine synthesizing protein D
LDFIIQINTAPYHSQSAYTALQFSQSALQQGHHIKRIFFYHEGIYNAFATTEPPANEFNMIANWSALAKQYHLDLLVCISAAQQRGLKLQDNDSCSLLADGFRIGGLGEMVEAMIEADRIMIF